jgi:hypothetical protein
LRGAFERPLAPNGAVPLEDVRTVMHRTVTVAAERVQRVSLRTWLIVSAAGTLALTAWFLVGPLLGPSASQGYYRQRLNFFTYGYNRPLMLLFIPFGLALLAWRRGDRVPVRWLLGGAIAFHLLLAAAPTQQSQDIHQYLFYGRMQVIHSGSTVPQLAAHAGNPYVVHPSVSSQDPWYPWIRWPNQTTVYGPVWSLLSYLVALGAGGSHTAGYLLMKLLVLALDLAVMWMIVVASKDRPDPAGFAGFGILAYAWNPLILISVPLGGLVDVALAAGLVAALVAERRGRPWMATVLFTLTALVKIYAGIGLLLWLVLLVRRRGPRHAATHAALAVGISAVAFAPYWAGLSTFTGLFHVANLSNHSFAGVLQRLLTPLFSLFGATSPYHLAGALLRVTGLGLLLWSLVWAVVRTRTERDLWHDILVVLAAYCLFTPWFFYWYLVAPLAIVAVLPDDGLAAPILTASGTLLFTTAFWPWLLGQAVEVTVRYAPPVLVYALGLRAGPRATGAREQDIEAPAGPGPARTPAAAAP